MKGITVGQYVPGNSFLHRLDPRVKLVLNIAMIVLVFMSNYFLALLPLFAIAVIAFLGSSLRPYQLLRLFIPVFLIGVFLFLINLFVIKSGESTHHLFDPVVWWKLTVSETGMIRTFILMVRIYIMMVTTTLLISTTKPSALTRAIEDLLWPLRLVRFPVHIVAMIISIALRFIPTLLEEAQRIMKAQSSRGVDFKNGSFYAKVKSLTTLIIPLFVSAFAKAEDLSNAMEVRGYDPYGKRVRYRVYKLGWRDVGVLLLYVALIVYVALIIHGVIIMPYWT